MSDENPDSKDKKPNKEVAESPFPTDIGKLNTNNAEGANRQPHNTEDDPEIFFERIGQWACRLWEDLKDSGNSNRVIAVFTVIIALAGIVYTVSSIQQWRVMSTQLDLTRREMKGTEAAIVRLAVGGIGSDGINIGINNSGHWIAAGFWAKLEIGRESLPDHTPIGAPYTCDLNIPQVPPGDFPGANQMCSLPKFSDLDWDEIQHTTERQTIKITASYGYDDGFGGIVPKSICEYLFTRPPYVMKNGTSVTPTPAFYDCDRYEDILESYRRNKK